MSFYKGTLVLLMVIPVIIGKTGKKKFKGILSRDIRLKIHVQYYG